MTGRVFGALRAGDLGCAAGVVALALATDWAARQLASFPSVVSAADLAAAAATYAVLVLPAVLAFAHPRTRRLAPWLFGLPFGFVIAGLAANAGLPGKTVLVILAAGTLLAAPMLGRIRLRWIAAAVAMLVGIATWRGASVGVRTADAAKPSVLLVVLDTVSARHLSTYGYGRPTDVNLAKLAAGGMLYRRAVSPAPWTIPSHASLFTGFYPSELGFDGSNFSIPSWPGSLAADLSLHGYESCAVSANPGLAGWSELATGFTHFWSEHRLTSPLTSLLAHWVLGQEATYQTHGMRVSDLALDWIDRRSTRGAPWFLFVNYLDAHAPYDPPDEQRHAFAPGLGPHHLAGDNRVYNAKAVSASPATRAEMQQLYDGEVAAMDAALGSLLDALQARGYGESNLLVIVTADHGESFGEHGFFGHLLGMPDPVLHVPLVLSGYGVPRGVVAAGVQPVQVRSTVDTILGLPVAAGAAPPLPPWGAAPDMLISEHPQPVWYMDELGRYGTAFTPPAEWQGNWTAVERDGVKVVFDDTFTRGAAYDLASDPEEERPLPLERGLASLDRYRTWRSAVAVNGASAPSELSEAAKERLRAVGYLQ
jgi:arylsulfatase A-like enzyme